MKIVLFRWELALFCIIAFLISGCEDTKKSVEPEFIFKHKVNGFELQKGAMNYVNKAGNLYRVDELQYFISEITIKTSEGQIIPLTTDNGIHYVDINIPTTLTWRPVDPLPVTNYSSISFVFGITEMKNKTGLFVNPPERDMFWPELMGGGYHYMKMNGQWKSIGDTVKPFNFHLGMGMEKDKKMIPNSFTVTLPLNVNAGSLSNVFTITMNIDKWFEAPNVWNWNLIGGQIMQNQEAMRKASENGVNAFSVSHEGKDIVYHD